MISLAAFEWCREMRIPIALVGADSRLSAFYAPPSAPDGPLKRAQAVAAVTDGGLEVARSLLRRKLESQISALEANAQSRSAGNALGEVRDILSRVGRAAALGDFLSLEGRAAQAYWRGLAGLTLPWPVWAQQRVPDHWLRVWPREYGLRGRVADATDPFNAILNYGYSLLEVETRVAAAKHSLDPDLGLLHVDKRLRESLIFDLMEPLRARVVSLALEFCESYGLRPHMFAELPNGVVRLAGEFAQDYAQWLMPQLSSGADLAAGSFATDIRRIQIPYRLVDERTVERKLGTRKGVGGPCGTCGKPLPKLGLKFCSRHCYLKHSIEVARPIEKAREKLAELRARGYSPGHGGEAAKKRGAAIAAANRRRSLNLTDVERRARRAAQARERRARNR